MEPPEDTIHPTDCFSSYHVVFFLIVSRDVVCFHYLSEYVGCSICSQAIVSASSVMLMCTLKNKLLAEMQVALEYVFISIV